MNAETFPHGNFPQGAVAPSSPSKASVRFTYSHPAQSLGRRALIRTVEFLSGQPALRRLYLQWSRSEAQTREPIFSAALRLLKLDLRIKNRHHLAALPASGGVLLIANHPFGIVDGLTMGHLALGLRPEVGIMTNSLLCQVPEVLPYLLPVDFSGTAAARRLTAETRQRAADLLAHGQTVAIFPAGGVATANHPFRGPAVDSPWHPFVGKLATLPGVTTLPVHFSGQNSRLFQIASHTSYALRVALIFRETRKRRRVELTLGAPISPAALNGLGRQAATDHLRRMTMNLASPPLSDPDEVFIWPKRIKW